MKEGSYRDLLLKSIVSKCDEVIINSVLMGRYGCCLSTDDIEMLCLERMSVRNHYKKLGFNTLLCKEGIHINWL